MRKIIKMTKVIYTIRKSKNFKDMFAIYKDNEVYDEPHYTIRKAKTQLKRFGLLNDFGGVK